MTARRSILTMALTVACSPGSNADREFEGVQSRGRVAMGVDQYTSTHLFQPRPDGGRIELHAGNFSIPASCMRVRFREPW